MFKQPAAHSPTALGIMLQASSYLQAIPIIYGRAKSTALLIWLDNLRKAGSDKKWKQKKKGPPTYVANADVLFGHNPILCALQAWRNNEPKFALNFTSQQFTIGGPTFTVSDAHFYAVIGVTVTAPYNVSFNDYGGVPQTLSGNYEIPLFNSYFLGPDPSLPAPSRFFPNTYRWQPGMGATIYVDACENGLANPYLGYTLNVYYAQLAGPKYQAPMTKLRLTFEDQLGNGSEFSGNYASKQIIYPMFAGAGSPNLDLGFSAAAPKLNFEMLGRHALYASGDGDFADFIEDIFAGAVQAGYSATGSPANYKSLTQAQHGVNCYDYPQVVQLKTVQAGINLGGHNLVLNAPLEPNDVIIAIKKWQGGGVPAAPTDDQGGAYTTIASGVSAANTYQYGIFYKLMTGYYPAGNTLYMDHSAWNEYFVIVLRGAPTFDQVSVLTGTVPTNDPNAVQVTTTNDASKDAIIFGLFIQGNVVGDPSATLWNVLQNNQSQNGFTGSPLLVRRVTQPGTYKMAGLHPGAGDFVTALFSFKATQPRSVAAAIGNVIDKASLDLVRQQCRAYGLIGSLAMMSQKQAADWLKQMVDDGETDNGGFPGAANAAPFYSGSKLKFFPWAEASAVGNGATYISPTAAGPIADLSADRGDFILDSDPPEEIDRSGQAIDAPNIFQFTIPARASDYNPVTISEPLAGGRSMLGWRKDSPKQLDCVMDPTVARKLLIIKSRRASLLRNQLKIKGDDRYQLFEPGDLTTMSASAIGMTKQPFRFRSLDEDPSTGVWTCVLEPFIYGLYSPDAVTASSPSGSGQNRGGDPGSVNAPIFFQPVARLAQYENQAYLWIVVSGGNANYGGCYPYVSTDGGASYVGVTNNGNPVPILGSAVTGFSVGDWPAAADPDTTNDLTVDVSESLGVIPSHSVSDEDNFIYPFWIAGGTTAIPYELGAWAVSQLVSANKYTLKATGGGTNHLRRAVYAAPQVGQGVDHPNNSRFCLLDPNGVGMLKIPIDNAWIGQTTYWKFPAFDILGNNAQQLTDPAVIAYPYTIIEGQDWSEFLINGN